MSNKNPNKPQEQNTVPADQGAAAFMAGVSKPGYEFVKMERKGTKVKVYFKKKA